MHTDTERLADLTSFARASVEHTLHGRLLVVVPSARLLPSIKAVTPAVNLRLEGLNRSKGLINLLAVVATYLWDIQALY